MPPINARAVLAERAHWHAEIGGALPIDEYLDFGRPRSKLDFTSTKCGSLRMRATIAVAIRSSSSRLGP